ncbi:hypothetical protein [Calycomorphotria hydatis]|uniref:Uncharacterized protein n=1 Tax=Calycomorphotria hydatis TaxID=2528027 RepID=A0A517TBQ9_9PLAN|nr:hypothetical protein [Calycomorphotria hydatis]QDT65812.1 hypothetical protein V22_30740 [Calycomorphotria hydatis]
MLPDDASLEEIFFFFWWYGLVFTAKLHFLILSVSYGARMMQDYLKEGTKS